MASPRRPACSMAMPPAPFPAVRSSMPLTTRSPFATWPPAVTPITTPCQLPPPLPRRVGRHLPLGAGAGGRDEAAQARHHQPRWHQAAGQRHQLPRRVEAANRHPLSWRQGRICAELVSQLSEGTRAPKAGNDRPSWLRLRATRHALRPPPKKKRPEGR